MKLSVAAPRDLGEPVQGDGAAVEVPTDKRGVQGVAECADADAPLVELRAEPPLQLSRELRDRTRSKAKATAAKMA